MEGRSRAKTGWLICNDSVHLKWFMYSMISTPVTALEHRTSDWVRSKINFPVGLHEPLLGNCQETETCTVWACHTPRQPLYTYPSGHLGGRATPWQAEEMLNGQHQRVDIPACSRIAHKGFLQQRQEEDPAESSLMSPRRLNRSRD